eukprot:g1801.t1
MAFAGPLQDKAAEVEKLLSDGKGVEAIQSMRQALFEVWSEAPLSIPTATYVKAPADGFGIYTVRADNRFAEGEPLLIYLEPVGFDWKQQDELYTSLLTVDFDLATPDGNVLAGQKAFGRFDFKSHVPNTEYMANLTLNVSGAPSGDYVLVLTVNDENGGGSAKADILNERGMSVALHDYALGVQHKLGHEVFVFYYAAKSNPSVVEKFGKSVTMVPIKHDDDSRRISENLKLDFCYYIREGRRSRFQIEAARSGVHVVFRHFEPYGDVYAYVSDWLADWMTGGRAPAVPHIVDLPVATRTLREDLGIPADAHVIGRYGGSDQFNIPFAHNAVKRALERRQNLWFLFVNTDKFIDHPRALFLPSIVDQQQKSNFIATCDAGLNAKKIGKGAQGAVQSLEEPIGPDMKLYDCFVFHNEFDLLEIRLREMGDHVDHFVLVEANQTQRGNSKPYYFSENRERFAAWADKIIDLQISFPEELPPALGVYKNRRKKDWERENYQRNCIARALETCSPEDLILLSDVDEIIRHEVLELVLREKLYKGRLLVFEQSLHKHHLNRIVPHKSWLLGSRMIEKANLTTPQQLRRTKARMTKKSYVPVALAQPFLRLRNHNLSGIGQPVKIIPNAGWHFSSMGGLDAFRTKLESVVHGQTVDTSNIDRLYQQELVGTELTRLDDLPGCVREGMFGHMLDPGGETGNS